MSVVILGGLILFTRGEKPLETNSAISPDIKEKIYFKEAVGKKAPDFLFPLALDLVQLAECLMLIQIDHAA